MGLFNLGKLFSYASPDKPMSEEKLRRFQLMGMTNKQLNEILGKRPHLHVKKVELVEMIIENEASLDNP